MRLAEFTDDSTHKQQCTGYTPDHATNTANSVLPACTDDLGLNKVTTYTFPTNKKISDALGWRRISVTQAALSASSYDVETRATLEDLIISGSGFTPDGHAPLGLLLFTNSFRSFLQTGASTKESEALVLLMRSGVTIPHESSVDTLNFPFARNLVGPAALGRLCTSMYRNQCPNQRRRLLASFSSLLPVDSDTIQDDPAYIVLGGRRRLQSNSIREALYIPRAEVITVLTPPAVSPSNAVPPLHINERCSQSSGAPMSKQLYRKMFAISTATLTLLLCTYNTL